MSRGNLRLCRRLAEFEGFERSIIPSLQICRRARRFLAIVDSGLAFRKSPLSGETETGASRYCPRTADGPRPQHVSRPS